MRCFFAIKIPDQIKDEIVQIEKSFEIPGMNCKFIASDNLHITTLFLGNVNQEEIPNLIEMTKNEITATKFSISIHKSGIFNQNKVPGIIFLDIAEGADELTGIHKMLSLCCKNILIRNNQNNKFKSHLTIGRIKHIEKSGIQDLINKVESTSVNLQFDANKLILFESILTNKNPIYKELASISLK